MAQGWCNFAHEGAAVPPLGDVRAVSPMLESEKSEVARVVSAGEKSLKQQQEKERGKEISSVKHALQAQRGRKLRLVFFFTVYKDEASLVRLIRRLYSPDHFYLIHVDPRGSASGFMDRLEKALAVGVLPSRSGSDSENRRKFSNIAVSQSVSIIYGASTASILLSRAMAWCVQNDEFINQGIEATRSESGSNKQNKKQKWDYFVPLTGFDYPLVSLADLQTILASSHVPGGGENGGFMPFLMAWSAEASVDVRRLQSKHQEVFSDDEQIRKSIELTWAERGDAKKMGSSPMEMRAYSYGPPLSCNGGFGYYRLESRVSRNDTQWLFPREGAFRNSRGKASIGPRDENGQAMYRDRVKKGQGRDFNNRFGTSYSNFDGEHRMWRKSDPGTSAAYDRRSTEYVSCCFPISIMHITQNVDQQTLIEYILTTTGTSFPLLFPVIFLYLGILCPLRREGSTTTSSSTCSWAPRSTTTSPCCITGSAHAPLSALLRRRPCGTRGNLGCG